MTSEFPLEQLRTALIDLKQNLERQKDIYREMFILAIQSRHEATILKLEKEILELKEEMETVEGHLRKLN